MWTAWRVMQSSWQGFDYQETVVIALPKPSPHKLWWSGSPPPCRRATVPLRCLVCWHRLAQQRGPKHLWRGENILPTSTKPGLEFKMILGVKIFEWTWTSGNLNAQSIFNHSVVLQRGLVWNGLNLYWRSVRTFQCATQTLLEGPSVPWSDSCDSCDRYTGPSGPPACPDALADVAEGAGAQLWGRER